jgi:hypothetical protein
MRTRKSWREKLETIQEPKVVAIPPKMRKRFGEGTMLIPRPLDVDAMIRTVKTGELVTQSQIRTALAGRFHADVTCPITTGIFVRIAAEAAEEDARAGKKRVTPYWRVVRDDGGLIDKLPGGVEAQARRLRAEGHTIDRTRKPCVKNFAKA